MKKIMITLAALACWCASAVAQDDSSIGNSGPQLTVASWNDLNHWADWLQLKQATFQADAEKWPLPQQQRFSVLVKGLYGQPVRNCTVRLLDAAGESLWRSQTNALGQSELWCEADKKAHAIRVCHQEQEFTMKNPLSFEKGGNNFSIPASCQPPAGIEVLALVDATHSMRDEFEAILQALANTQGKPSEVQMQTMLFRDYGERFLTLPIDLKPESGGRDFRWQAAGGGAEEEPLDTALLAAIRIMKEKPEADMRIILLFTDAIPKGMPSLTARALVMASAAGIAIVPVACSGLGQEGEFLLRSLALATNAPFGFLTDDSGIGELHRRPAVSGSTNKQALDTWIIGLVQSMANKLDCPESLPTAASQPLIGAIQCFPNPASEQANLQIPEAISRLSVRNSLGQVVHRQGQLDAGTHQLNVRGWAPGNYWIEIEAEGAMQVLGLVVGR